MSLLVRVERVGVQLVVRSPFFVVRGIKLEIRLAFAGDCERVGVRFGVAHLSCGRVVGDCENEGNRDARIDAQGRLLICQNLDGSGAVRRSLVVVQ